MAALRRMLSVVPGAVNSKNSSSKFELSKKNNVKNQDDLRGSLSRDCTELPYPFPSPEILSAAHVYHQTTQIQECPYPEEFSREEMAALSIRAVISTYEQAVVNNNRKSLRSSKQNSYGHVGLRFLYFALFDFYVQNSGHIHVYLLSF